MWHNQPRGWFPPLGPADNFLDGKLHFPGGHLDWFQDLHPTREPVHLPSAGTPPRLRSCCSPLRSQSSSVGDKVSNKTHPLVLMTIRDGVSISLVAPEGVTFRLRKGWGASPGDGVLKEKPSQELKREQVSSLPAPNPAESVSCRFQERARRSMSRPSQAQNKGEGEAEGGASHKGFSPVPGWQEGEKYQNNPKTTQCAPCAAPTQAGEPEAEPTSAPAGHGNITATSSR